MAKGHKPVAGSRAYWPKKRAQRIYPRLRPPPSGKEAVPLGFAGYKAGMTQLTVVDRRKGSVTEGQEVSRPVTVMDCPPLHVHGIVLYHREEGRRGAETVIVEEKGAKDLVRKTTIPHDPQTKDRLAEVEKALDRIADIRLLVHTIPRSAGLKKKTPELFELPLGGDVAKKWAFAREKLGTRVRVGDVFKDGEWLDVSAVTTGKGTQGPVKRFGVKIRGRKHKKKQRHVGNLGARGPARIFPGAIAMAGQLGFQTRTEYNKQVIKIGSGDLTPAGGWVRYGRVSGDYLLLAGSVPGPKKRLIMMRKGIRALQKAADPPVVKTVVLDSQQGV